MLQPTNVRGVVLDVDGTLVDSNDAHAHAWVRALREAGYRIPFERVRTQRASHFALLRVRMDMYLP